LCALDSEDLRSLPLLGCKARLQALVYAGSVDNATALELRQALDPLGQARSRLPTPVKVIKPKWVRPDVLVEVGSRMPNGPPRHSKLQGLSEAEALEVVREAAASASAELAPAWIPAAVPVALR